MKRFAAILLLFVLCSSCALADENRDYYDLAMIELRDYLHRESIMEAHNYFSRIGNNANHAQLFKSYSKALLDIHDAKYDDAWFDLLILSANTEFTQKLEEEQFPKCDILITYIDARQLMQEKNYKKAFDSLYNILDGDCIWDMMDLKRTLLIEILNDKDDAYAFACELQEKDKEHPGAIAIFRALRGYTPPTPTPKPASTPTLKPANLTVTSYAGYNYLIWNFVGGTCNVYRKEGWNGSWVRILTTERTRYSDYDITDGKTYYYYIESNTAKSNEASIVAKGKATPTSLPTLIQLNGNMNGEKVALSWSGGSGPYQIYRRSDASKGYDLLTEVKTSNYVDRNIIEGMTYYYRIECATAKSNIYNCKVVITTQKPTPAPTSRAIRLSVNAYVGYNKLQWNEINEYYTVYRRVGQTGSWKELNTTANCEYIDYNIYNGTTYSYYVESVWNGIQSNITTVTGKGEATPTATVKPATAPPPTARPWGSWSDWSTNWVSSNDNRQVETKQQYQYRDKTTQSGYTAWSSWSAWDTNPASATMLLDVDTKVETTTKTTYSYDRWYYYNTEAKQWWDSWAHYTGENYKPDSGSWQYKTSDTPLAVVEYKNGYPRYKGGWWHQTTNTETINTTYYRTRTRSTTTTEVWGNWSSWSDVKPTETYTREVNTRTLYRYRTR